MWPRCKTSRLVSSLHCFPGWNRCCGGSGDGSEGRCSYKGLGTSMHTCNPVTGKTGVEGLGPAGHHSIQNSEFQVQWGTPSHRNEAEMFSSSPPCPYEAFTPSYTHIYTIQCLQTERDFSSVETWVGPYALMEMLQSSRYMKNMLSKFGLYPCPRLFWGRKKKPTCNHKTTHTLCVTHESA